MSERKDDDWIDKLRARPAYRSIHGEEGSKVAGESREFDWRVPAGFALIAILVLAGVVVALRSVEPNDPWLDLLEMRVESNEACLFILVVTSGDDESPDWSKRAYTIAIDTYGKQRGGRRLPGPAAATIPSGAEFLLEIKGPDRSSLKVVSGYDPFGEDGPIVSPENPETPFVPLRFQSNRERFGRNGKRYPAIEIDRGALRVAEVDSTSHRPSSLTDVAIKDGVLEIRIPWALLNVTDPSSISIIHSPSAGREEIGTTETEGFRLYAYSINLENDEIADKLPSGGLAPLFRWSTWDSPAFTREPKQGLNLVSSQLNALPDHPESGRSDAQPDDEGEDSTLTD